MSDSSAVARANSVLDEVSTRRRKRDTETAELEYDLADELGNKDDFPDELIERVLESGGISVVYGDTNTGKTFFVLDLACAIAGADDCRPWMGRMVEPGLVVYLASEAPKSVRMRVRAYQRHHRRTVSNLAIVRSPINLWDGSADTKRVIRTIRAIEARKGEKCQLVIGDTLARLSAGAKENAGEDMGIVLRHADLIRHGCATHFMFVHHSGKDAAKGMRGWSGMRAAIDTELEVTDTDGARAAEITKQRDLEGKGERIGFRLEAVTLGTGKWGKPVTSCIVVSADPPVRVSRGKRPSEIAGAVVEALTTRGAGMKKGELVDHFEGRYSSGAVYRELKKMREAGQVHEVAGIVGLRRG